MKTPLKVKFEIAANELHNELNEVKAKTSIMNKETRTQKLYDISGRAITIRQIINEEHLLASIYTQLEIITQEALQLMGK